MKDQILRQINNHYSQEHAIQPQNQAEYEVELRDSAFEEFNEKRFSVMIGHKLLYKNIPIGGELPEVDKEFDAWLTILCSVFNVVHYEQEYEQGVFELIEEEKPVIQILNHHVAIEDEEVTKEDFEQELGIKLSSIEEGVEELMADIIEQYESDDAKRLHVNHLNRVIVDF